MLKLMLDFISDEQGAELMEYALIGAVVSVAALVGLISIGSTVSAIFSDLSVQLSFS